MPVSYLLNIDQIHQNSRYREVTLENARVPYLQTISLLHIDVLSNYFEAIGVLLFHEIFSAALFFDAIIVKLSL